MARKIVITSGKGGVGKTTVAANLGMRLSVMGERVVLADTDFGLNNIDVVCGVENRIVYDIVDAIEGRCRPKQALVQHPEYPNLFVLASNHTDPNKYISPQTVRLILDNLAPRFDYILIDSPAGIDSGFHRAAACAEEALLVTTPHISALRDADRVAGILSGYRFSFSGLVVNLVRRERRRGELLSPEEIAATLRLPLVASLPEDDKVFSENIIVKSRAFRTLAEAVLGVCAGQRAQGRGR